ncbi:MAG: CRTAC1 family protein [Planctomycetota bacterium]
MIVACFLLQSFLATPAAPRVPGEPVVALVVPNAGAPRVAAFLRPGDLAPFPLPLSTRSERVARAEFGPNGFHLALFGAGDTALDALRVTALPHAAAAQVLVSEEGLVWVGPPRLPERVSIGAVRDALPLLARQDHVAVQDCVVLIQPPERLGPEERLVLLPPAEHAGVDWFTYFVREETAGGGWGAGRSFRVRASSRHAAVLRTAGRRVQVLLSSGGADEQGARPRLDQAFYATVRRVNDFAPRALELTRAELAPIEATTVVDVQGAGPRTRVPALRGPSREALDVTDVVAWKDDVAAELEQGSVLRAWFEPPAEDEDGRPAGNWTLLVHLDPRPLNTAATGPRELVSLGLAASEDDEDDRGDATQAVLGTEPALAGWLADVTRDVGLATMHLEGPDEQLDIRPTMGPGAAFGDVDGDGFVDLYLVQGASREGSAPLANRLFMNKHGTFRDATEESRTGHTGAGMGALFFDPDGDGDLDLYVANRGPDVFYVNGGTGLFLDATESAGIAGDRWSASAVAGDADEDGDLDLYVTSYLVYDTEALPALDELARYQREDPVEMLPFAFPAAANVYYRNDSFHTDGARREHVRFVDATKDSGLADAAGRGMQAAFWDFDRDGDLDLYIANDVSYNVLFRNEGGGRFRDVSFSTGMDDPRGGMGVAIGDVDGDRDEDLFLTNWQLEPNALYANNLLSHASRRHRVGTFRDRTVDAGFAAFGVGYTSWGAELFDLENDGDLDLFVSNGYTSPDYESTGICVGQPNHLFVNDGSGRFRAAFAEAGAALTVERASRAALTSDFDQDGAVDLFVTSNNGLPQMLANRAPRQGRWIGLRLRQDGPNRFAIGATVEVSAGDRTWLSTLRAGTGYLGGNAPELHFGLGDVEAVDRVSVRWPDGTLSEHGVELDRWVTLKRP